MPSATSSSTVCHAAASYHDTWSDETYSVYGLNFPLGESRLLMTGAVLGYVSLYIILCCIHGPPIAHVTSSNTWYAGSVVAHVAGAFMLWTLKSIDDNPTDGTAINSTGQVFNVFTAQTVGMIYS